MGNGISLHLGLNAVDPSHYAGWAGPLNACEADAHSMAQLAQSRGFKADVKLTSEATRGALLNFLNLVSKTLREGDMFFLSYSGHGGQVPDLNGDEDDGMDETWCLFDGQLIDDELYFAFSKIPQGVRGLVLADSCHSGTSIKDVFYASQYYSPQRAIENMALPVFRNMPAEIALRTYEQNRAFYESIASALPDSKNIEKGNDLKATVRLISGCQDNQLSSDGAFNGAFTAALLRVWNGGTFDGNYAAFHKAIVNKMPPSQTPNEMVIGRSNTSFDDQTPFTI